MLLLKAIKKAKIKKERKNRDARLCVTKYKFRPILSKRTFLFTDKTNKDNSFYIGLNYFFY